MKNNIHPKYNKASVRCNSCGHSFTTGSTIEEINVEICSECHPFYTGKTTIVDTENLVKKFESRQKLVDSKSLQKKRDKKTKRSKKTQEVTQGKAVTLKDMLKDLG